MDGNNRWAKARGLPAVAGHRAGVEVIREAGARLPRAGVEVLTLFAFSSENWQRPRDEVRALMELFLRYLRGEVRELHKQWHPPALHRRARRALRRGCAG